MQTAALAFENPLAPSDFHQRFVQDYPVFDLWVKGRLICPPESLVISPRQPPQTPEEDSRSHHLDRLSVACVPIHSFGFLDWYFGAQSVQCVFRLGELAPIRLALALLLQAQWVAAGGWLDLTGQGFPAEIAGVYQWWSVPIL